MAKIVRRNEALRMVFSSGKTAPAVGNKSSNLYVLFFILQRLEGALR